MDIFYTDELNSDEFKESEESNPIQIIQLKFSLTKSSYATMLLREYLSNELDLKNQKNIVEKNSQKNQKI